MYPKDMYPIGVSMFAFNTKRLPQANTIDLGHVTGPIRNHSVNNITRQSIFNGCNMKVYNNTKRHDKQHQ